MTNTLWELVTWLANADLLDRGWNITGLGWAGVLVLITMFEFRRRSIFIDKHDRPWILCVSVGVCTVLLFHTLIDELEMFLFIFTRVDWRSALTGFAFLGFKWIRWFGHIPLMAYIAWRYVRFDLDVSWRTVAVFPITAFISILQYTFAVYDMRRYIGNARTWNFVLFYCPKYTLWFFAYLALWGYTPKKIYFKIKGILK